MSYRRSSARRSTRSSRRSTSRRAAPRRSYRSRAAGRRSSGGRVQTVRIVLEGHVPSGVQRPVGIGQMTAAPQRTRPQF